MQTKYKAKAEKLSKIKLRMKLNLASSNKQSFHGNFNNAILNMKDFL